MGYGVPAFDSVAGRPIVPPARLATFAMTGSGLLGLLEFGLKVGGDVFPNVSGLRLTYDSSRSPAEPWILPGTVHIGGAPLDVNQPYTITANEVLLMFLPDFGFEIQDPQVLADSVQDAARAFAESQGILGPRTSGRLRDVAGIPRGP